MPESADEASQKCVGEERSRRLVFRAGHAREYVGGERPGAVPLCSVPGRPGTGLPLLNTPGDGGVCYFGSVLHQQRVVREKTEGPTCILKPQGFEVLGHAGLVINRLFSRTSSSVRLWWELGKTEGLKARFSFMLSPAGEFVDIRPARPRSKSSHGCVCQGGLEAEIFAEDWGDGAGADNGPSELVEAFRIWDARLMLAVWRASAASVSMNPSVG